MAISRSGQIGGVQAGVPAYQSAIGYTAPAPIPIGSANQWAQLGDSRTTFGFQNAAAATYVTSNPEDGSVPDVSSIPVGRRNQGYQHWAEMLSRGGMQFPGSLNYGYAGGTLAGTGGSAKMGYMVERCIQGALAAGATGIVFWEGTNSINSNSATVESLIAAHDEVLKRITSSGLQVIYLTDGPRGSAGFAGLRSSATNLKTALRFRAWQIQQSARYGVYVIDMHSLFGSVTATTGDFASDSLTFDGVHQSSLLAQYLGRAIVNLGLSGPPRRRRIIGAVDAYHVTDNPYGCITANPQMQGTGGGAVGTNGSGTLPNSWSQNSTTSRTGWTSTYSLVSKTTETGPQSWSQIAIAGSANPSPGATDGFVQFLGTGLIPAGSRIQVFGEAEWDAGMVGVSGVQIGVFISRSSIATVLYDGAESNMRSPLDSSSAWGGTYQTEPYVVPSDFTGINLIANIVLHGAAIPNATVRFRNIGIRYV